MIRATKPEIVIGINHHDSWGGPSWNHADHRNVGRGLLDAARDAAELILKGEAYLKGVIVGTYAIF